MELMKSELDHKKQLELEQAKNGYSGSTYVTGKHNAYMTKENTVHIGNVYH